MPIQPGLLLIGKLTFGCAGWCRHQQRPWRSNSAAISLNGAKWDNKQSTSNNRLLGQTPIQPGLLLDEPVTFGWAG